MPGLTSDRPGEAGSSLIPACASAGSRGGWWKPRIGQIWKQQPHPSTARLLTLSEHREGRCPRWTGGASKPSSGWSPHSCLHPGSWHVTFWRVYIVCVGCTHGTWKVPGCGSNRSYNYRPAPQSQQRQIRATSVSYITAHGNTGSLTH